MGTIVVTDGHERVALAIVRSLGASGEDVVVCSPGGRSLAGASRFARAEEVVQGLPSDPSTYLEGVEELVRRVQAEFLIPVSEASLRMLLPHADRLAPTRMPFPRFQTFADVSDKALLMQTARCLGMAVPEEIVVPVTNRFNGLVPGGEGAVSFPAVVKPSRSFTPTEKGGRNLLVTHVRTPAELRRAIRSYPAEGFPLLVQRRIVGPGMGVFVLLWDGEPRAVFSHRRIREKPPSGGVSVCRESVDPDPSLLAAALRLLEHVGWQGVAMVEFKLEERTGTPFLMEVNGRFWGSLQLAIDAGVDFPRLLVDAARGSAFDGMVTGNGYVRSRWFWGEVDHLLTRVQGNGEGPAKGPWTKLLAAGEILRWQRGDRMEVLRWSDRRPFLKESSAWIRHVVRRNR